MTREELAVEAAKHIGALRSAAYKLCSNKDDVEDLVQDTIVRALDQVKNYREGCAIVGWLRVVMRNIYYTQREHAALCVRKSDAIAFEWDDVPITPEEALQGK